MPDFLASLKNIKEKTGKGFTLIELLIAVSIIAILVSIGTASFLRAQKQARDSQRKSDLGELRSALEQFYGDNNRSPIDNDDGQIQCGNPLSPLSWNENPPIPFSCTTNSVTTTYLSELPDDPKTGQDYYYEARDISDDPCIIEDDCQRFKLGAKLENENDSDRVDSCLISNDYCLLNP